MNDEKYVFITDCAEKKRTARGIHNKRTHAGKGGKVIFLSDYLTRKEREAMNSEVKTYALNRPMRWKEFKMLPDDVRREYIENLQKRFGVMQKDLAAMFGVSVNSVALETKKLGIKFPHRGGWANTNNGGFRAFCAEEPKADHVEAPPEPVHSTPEVAEPSEEVKAPDAPPVQNRGGRSQERKPLFREYHDHRCAEPCILRSRLREHGKVKRFVGGMKDARKIRKRGTERLTLNDEVRT